MKRAEQLSMFFEGFDRGGKRKKVALVEPLRTAAFVEEKDDEWYAKFDAGYLMFLMNSIGEGRSRAFLKSKLKHHDCRYHMPLNEFEVDMLIEDIESYNTTGEWMQLE